MKIKQKLEPSIKTNSNSKKYKFNLNEEFVLDTLRTRIYHYPIKTLVQEYISNGRDANLESNSKKNLKVQAPTDKDPVFRVRDYGCGMSPERIEIFISYGKSTKRDSTKLTGGFGYGGKSAFSYTDNFTIISYINGIASHYLAYVGDDHGGVLELQGEYPTTEENGTEIIIGVKAKDFFEFNSAICRATFFWDQRPDFQYLLENQHFKKDLIYFSEYKPVYKIKNYTFYLNPPDNHSNYFFRPKTDGGYKNKRVESGIVILVDKIPYPLYDEYQHIPELVDLLKIIEDYRIVTIDLNNDDLEIAPNRESLQNSKITLDKLRETFKSMTKEIIDHQLEVLKSTQSFQEYASERVRFNQLFKQPDFVKFKGQLDTYQIDQFNLLHADNLLELDYTVGSHSYQDFSFDNKDSAVINVENCLLIYEDSDEGKNTIRGKMRQAIKKKYNNTVVCFMKEIGATPSSLLAKETKDSTVFKTKKKTNPNEVYINEILVKQLPQALQSVSSMYDRQIERDSKLVTLNNLSARYIYTQHKDGEIIYGDEFSPQTIPEKELRDLTLYLKEKGYSFCSIAPSFVRRVEQSPFFTTLDDYLESSKNQDIQDNRTYRLLTLIGKNRYSEIEPILNLITPDQFKDPVIKEGLSLLCEVYKNRQELKDGRTLPMIVLNNEVNDPQVTKEIETVNAFFTQIKAHYPLYSVFKLLSEERSAPIAKDFVLYFNSKFKELKC